MQTFVFQSGDFCVIEKRVVQTATMLSDDLHIAGRQDLEDLQNMPPGALRDQRHLCPVGTVEFCRAWMRAVGVTEPQPIDYPDCLMPALHRVVRRTTFGQAAIGSWVKPQRTKAWEPHLKQDESEHAADEPVWEAPVIHEQDWLAEWRVYVLGGEIVGEGRYDDNAGDDLAFDRPSVQEWVKRFEQSGDAPAAYALDVALWPKSRTVLVEVTDAWAMGYYRGTCRPLDYARMLAARWAQMAEMEEVTA